MHARFVVGVIGLLVAGFAVAMLPCALIDFIDGSANWRGFAISAMLTGLVGALLALIMLPGASRNLTRTDAFGITVFTWIGIALAASLPFMFHGMSFTDAYFEAMSGLTTTGATVITGLDNQSRGLLFWRSVLQWFGGIGLILLAMAILPVLRVGGMQLFKLENSDQSGKLAPRAGEIAGQIGLVYITLTGFCVLGYLAGGLGPFDAITHAMTTLSAGGFSTSDSSFGKFGHLPAVYVAIVFMAFSAMPFALFVLAARGHPFALFRDPQPRLFVAIALGASALICAQIWLTGLDPGRSDSPLATIVIFNVVSAMSGTGYATADYSLWGPFAQALFLGVMLAGGSGGSAAGGIKMFRIEIATAAAFSRFARIAHPNRIAPVRFKGRVVEERDVKSVVVFVCIFLGTTFVGMIGYSLLGYEPLTALSTALTCLANVGPGLGAETGPATTFQSLSDAATWLSTILMFLGRLELLAVLVVLTPRFWGD